MPKVQLSAPQGHREGEHPYLSFPLTSDISLDLSDKKLSPPEVSNLGLEGGAQAGIWMSVNIWKGKKAEMGILWRWSRGADGFLLWLHLGQGKSN